MKRVELYARVRHAVMIDGLSQREAARRFGIDPRTVKKMLSYSVPPGYVRTRPPVRPKLDPFIGIIDRILEEDKERPKKQRHTSKRINAVNRCIMAKACHRSVLKKKRRLEGHRTRLPSQRDLIRVNNFAQFLVRQVNNIMGS